MNLENRNKNELLLWPQAVSREGARPPKNAPRETEHVWNIYAPWNMSVSHSTYATLLGATFKCLLIQRANHGSNSVHSGMWQRWHPEVQSQCSLKVTWLDVVVWVFQQRLPWIFRTSQISWGVTVNGPINGPLLCGGQFTCWCQGSEVRRATVTQITTCSSQGMKNSISELWPWHWLHPRCHPELLLHCESLKIPYFDLW